VSFFENVVSLMFQVEIVETLVDSTLEDREYASRFLVVVNSTLLPGSPTDGHEFEAIVPIYKVANVMLVVEKGVLGPISSIHDRVFGENSLETVEYINTLCGNFEEGANRRGHVDEIHV
jgi:hypothetical protein